jgi:hypothetical protein
MIALAALALLACPAPDSGDKDGGQLYVDYGDDGGGESGGDDGGPADLDGDGHAEDVDCDDDDASIHPGADDTDCNGIDEDCDGTEDDDFGGDEGEPDDAVPRDLGTLVDDDDADVEGYLFPAYDRDRVRFHTVDGLDVWFGFEISLMDVPSDVDPWIELWLIEDADGAYVGLLDSVNAGAAGVDELLSFSGGWGDDTGTYEIVIQAGADASCSWPYLMKLSL